MPISRRARIWIWVIAGLFVTGVLCVVAVAGFGFYMFSKHVEIQTVSSESADHDFEEVRARFKGQKPILEFEKGGRFARSNTAEIPPHTTSPDSLHILAFDPDDSHIVRVAIPFWLLRMKMRGTRIDLNGHKMDLDDLRLSVEDLERYGPTLIVDHTGDDGGRVLVWSQ